MAKYRPPLSDSEEEDYDGFYFGGDKLDSKERSVKVAFDYHPQPVVECGKLIEYVTKGDLEELKKEMHSLNWAVDKPLSGPDSFNLLLYACQFGHLNIIEYLLKHKKANPHYKAQTFTALFLICDCAEAEPEVIERVCRLLIERDAVVNIINKYGITPMFRACERGLVAVAKLFLDYVSLQTVDHSGRTCLFYAVEANSEELVKLLIDAGADPSVRDAKGISLDQIVHERGFTNILNLLPNVNIDCEQWPSYFLSYNKLSDYIPQMFPQTNCPEYFQEIYYLLRRSELEKFMKFFVAAKTSFVEFLCLTDADLMRIGVPYPYERKKILKCILEFHLFHRTQLLVADLAKTWQRNTFEEILIMEANHVQRLKIMTASIRFVMNNIENNDFGLIPCNGVKSLRKNFNEYRLIEWHYVCFWRYITWFCPSRNPLYINYNDYLASRKNKKVMKYIFVTFVLGLTYRFYKPNVSFAWKWISYLPGIRTLAQRSVYFSKI